MTLAQRLLVAIGLLTIATTVTLGFGVRKVWGHAEEERFREQFAAAVGRLETEIGEELASLPALLAPLCEHDPVLDGALVDLKGSQLDQGRRLALSLRVNELMKAYRLDELTLLTASGEVLGAGHAVGLVGSRSPKLAAKLRGDPGRAEVRASGAAPAIEAHCVRSMGGVTLGLHGGKRLDHVLARVGTSQGLSLSLAPPAEAGDLWLETQRLPELGGLPIYATRSRLPLQAALHGLDRAVLVLGCATLLAAMAMAYVMARGLARPIVSLAEQAKRVVTGEPLPVEGGGGRELTELARAFNQTLADLTALRNRLAATERIAARREIARRVAHEIKNPLAPIRAAVETLRRLRARNDPAFDDYFDEASRTVLDEVQRITAIVKEFTEFERLPAPSPAPLDLERTLRDVVGLHSASGIPIDLTAAALPAVVADRDQMVQVFTNLLQNAMDAVQAVRAPHISIRAARAGAEHVRVTVRDNGPGVAPSVRDRLFEPYATTKEHGTGLGLALVRRMVVEHGGDIAYADAPGGGAEFTVTLPNSGPALLPEPPPGSETAAGAGAGAHGLGGS